MNQSKAQTPHPLPPPHATNQSQEQPEHHKRHEGEVNDNDKISSQSIKCGHVILETSMAEDIPVTNDDNRGNDSVLHSSRRWIWSRWTWLGGLLGLIGLFSITEAKILWQESRIAEQLRERGYDVTYADGWQSRLIPDRWKPPICCFGDRVVSVDAYLTKKHDLEPLDDLIPQLQALRYLRTIEFVCPDGIEGELPTAIESIDRFVKVVSQLKTVKSVGLSHFSESQLTEKLVECIQSLDVECVLLFCCRSRDYEIARLKSFPRLKKVTLLWCQDAKSLMQQLRLDRPDVVINEVETLAESSYP